MPRYLSLLTTGLCVGLLGAALCLAQQSSSTSLVGTVTDSTGAVVPGAAIVAVQNATNVAYRGQANATGNYTIPFVAPGTYTITATRPGFAKSVHTNIIVENNQTVRTNFALTVGEQANTVTVTSTPPPIATDTASLSDTTSGTAIAQLPITDHDPLKLASTIAGVQLNGDDPNGNPPGETFTGPGERSSQNDITLDGVSVMNNLITTNDFRPSQAAVQELTVQTGTYSAQYGGYLGVHINAVSKAGGNTLHGTFSEAIRNDALDSRGVGELVDEKKNPLRYNQFATEVDGPVVLPGYNGKNKTFFMFSYEGLRDTNKNTGKATVLTDAERDGNFQGLTDSKGNPITISDPAAPSCVSGNVISRSCIDSHALELLNFMPKANQPGLTNNLQVPTGNRDNFNQYLTRGDEVLSDNARMYVRYGYQKGNPANFNVFYPDSVFSPSTQSNFVVGETQIFSPNVVNQVQLGRNKVSIETVNQFYLDPSLDSQLKAITIPGFAYPAGNPGETVVQFNNFRSIGNGGVNWFQGDETWSANDTLSYTHGAHNIIIGADLSRYYTTREAANNAQGYFNFDGTYSGYDGADFLLGLARQSITPTAEPFSSGLQWRDGFFALDKWNATRNLTLNVGLRYELPTVGRVPSGIGSTLSPNWRNLIPTEANGTVLSNPGSYPLYSPNHRQFAPRIGFAYRMGSDWVARGGFGIYYNPNQTNSYTLTFENPPFSTLTTYDSPAYNPSKGVAYDPTNQVTLSNPQPGSAAGPSPNPDIINLPPDFPSATMNQWSFDIERTLWSGSGLDVQYLGSHTDHLDTSWYNNSPHEMYTGSGALPTGAIACPAGSGTVGSANYDVQCDTSASVQARRPYTQIANALNANNPACANNAYAPGCALAWGNVRTISEEEYSNYEGLNAVFTQRMTRGVSMHLAYTWSHDLDQGVYSNGGGSPMDPYNWKLDYGNSNQDVRHRFVGTYIWEIPWGRGSSSGFVSDVLAGWNLSGVVTLRTGSPINVVTGSDNANIGRSNSQRPDLVSTPSASTCGQVLSGCINRAAFATPAAFTYGTAGRNLVFGPGSRNFDTSLAKSFRIGERSNFQIRAEAFNTFNHINWNNPSGNLKSSNFGRITSASSMREFEISGRLTF